LHGMFTRSARDTNPEFAVEGTEAPARDDTLW
jgi:hypothetical protein